MPTGRSELQSNARSTCTCCGAGASSTSSVQKQNRIFFDKKINLNKLNLLLLFSLFLFSSLACNGELINAKIKNFHYFNIFHNPCMYAQIG
jgi:hypothetical protein